jgi:lipid-A-disaccharide synthase-like uncharacterized protein
VARRALAALALALCALAPGAPARAQSAGEPPPRPAVHVDLQGRIKDVAVVERDGHLWVRNGKSEHAPLVPAETWLQALRSAQEEQRRHGVLYVLFNITSPWGFAWIAVGFLGQLLFTFRMLLQWWSSEKAKRSVVPVAFWWGSLFGGLLLFVYFCWRKDIIGILGQSTGIFVYVRNLVLIHRRAAAQSAARTEPRPAA